MLTPEEEDEEEANPVVGEADREPLMLPSSLRQRGTAAEEGKGGPLLLIAGRNVDIWLCGTSGLCTLLDLEAITTAIREKKPDVLVTQLCPTRMRLLLEPETSLFAYMELRPGSSLSRFVSLVLCRWVWACLGALSGRRRILGMEYIETVRLAAQNDVRVVLGDRDLPTIVARGWELLTFRDRLGMLKELLVVSMLPAAYARRALGLSTLSLRGSDVITEVLTLLASRHRSLGPLLREQRDYILSSVQKLDGASVRERWRPPGERSVVLVVVGRGHVEHIVEHWGSHVDRRTLAARRHGLGGRMGWLLALAFLCVFSLSLALFIRIVVLLGRLSGPPGSSLFGIQRPFSL